MGLTRRASTLSLLSRLSGSPGWIGALTSALVPPAGYPCVNQWVFGIGTGMKNPTSYITSSITTRHINQDQEKVNSR